MKTLIILLSLFSLSCSQQAASPELPVDSVTQDGTQLNDTLKQQQPVESINNGPYGFFRTVLPCKDCKGIEHTVLFNRNQTVRIEEVHLGKNISSNTMGNWKESDGIFTVVHQNTEARYSWKADSLNYLHPSGVAYTLQQLPAASDNQAWRNKGKEGLEFYGVGNEPFWNIKIDEERSIAFHQADWSKALIFQQVKRTQFKDSIVYTAGIEPFTLRAVIYPRFCSDGMSDFIYSHQVRILYDDIVFNGCGISYRN